MAALIFFVLLLTVFVTRAADCNLKGNVEWKGGELEAGWLTVPDDVEDYVKATKGKHFELTGNNERVWISTCEAICWANTSAGCSGFSINNKGHCRLVDISDSQQ